MAIDLCDVEETLRCNPSPDDELFKNLVLRALLGIAGGGGGGGGDVAVTSIAPGTNNIGKVVLTDGTSDATVRNLAANDALNVAIVDAAGNQITSFGGSGGGTEFAVGDATGATPNGGLMLFKDPAGNAEVVQQTQPVPVAQHAAQWAIGQTLNMASNANSNVYQINGAKAGLIQTTAPAGGGTLVVEGSLDGVNYITPMNVWDANSSPNWQQITTTISAVSATNVRTFTTRGFRFIRVRVNTTHASTYTYAISFGDGSEFMLYGESQLNVQVTAWAANNINPGNSASNLGKQEDAVQGTGDTGVANLFVRKDAPIANGAVSADGDYITPFTDNRGKTWTAGDQTDDLAYATGDRGSSSFGVRTDVPATITPAVGDYAPMRVSDFGAQWVEKVTRTAVFQTLGSMAFGSITAGYTTLLALTAGTKLFILKNLTDQDMEFSTDASTTKFYLEPGDRQSIDLAALGLSTALTISVRYVVAPLLGSVKCEAIS